MPASAAVGSVAAFRMSFFQISGRISGTTCASSAPCSSVAATHRGWVAGCTKARRRLLVAADDGDPVRVDLVDQRLRDVDEHGVDAAGGEAGTEDAPHRARADDCGSHAPSLIGRPSYNGS